jgi:uncharacterized protein (TIGR00730 family)
MDSRDISPSTRDPDVVRHLDEAIRLVGGNPDTLDGELIRETMQTALRMLTDPADLGQIKLISRSLRELRYAMKIFNAYKDVRKVSIFGSARTKPTHEDYKITMQFSRAIAEADWMVITGAGDGIMRAGHEGAGVERSFGVSIRLPFETNSNDVIAGDKKLMTFRYFFTRKLIFVSQCDALALFPGGFGTLDEAFEVLTLVQTGKAPMIPIVMVEPPGSGYWEHFDVWVRDHLLSRGLISPPDLNLYHIFNDPQEAALHVLRFYTNYHSHRYVGHRFVIRIHHEITPTQLERLNEEFKDLVADGRIEQTGVLEGEDAHHHLPRIVFTSTKRDYGRLRLLIDRLNQFHLSP